jgi:hypothetical protein
VNFGIQLLAALYKRQFIALPFTLCFIGLSTVASVVVLFLYVSYISSCNIKEKGSFWNVQTKNPMVTGKTRSSIRLQYFKMIVHDQYYWLLVITCPFVPRPSYVVNVSQLNLWSCFAGDHGIFCLNISEWTLFFYAIYSNNQIRNKTTCNFTFFTSTLRISEL